MKIRRIHRLLAALIAVAAAVLLLPAPAAQAHPVTAGSFDLRRSPEAEPLSYVVGVNATMLAQTTDDRNQVRIEITGTNGDYWSLELGAPYGEELSVGTYDGATRNWFREPGTPGLDFSGNGWGCNTLTGSFVVNEITMASPRYLQSIDATFEQYCEGTGDPATGHIVVTNPPPPPALTMAVTIDGTGTVTADGLVMLHGTVTCTRATDIELVGSVSQKIKGVTYQGSFATQFTCMPDIPVLWEATSVSDGPFRKGTVALVSTAWGYDSFYFADVRETVMGSVRLSRA